MTKHNPLSWQHQRHHRGYITAGGHLTEELDGWYYIGASWATHLTRRIEILANHTATSSPQRRPYTAGKLARYQAELALHTLIQKAKTHAAG